MVVRIKIDNIGKTKQCLEYDKHWLNQQYCFLNLYYFSKPLYYATDETWPLSQKKTLIWWQDKIIYWNKGPGSTNERSIHRLHKRLWRCTYVQPMSKLIKMFSKQKKQEEEEDREKNTSVLQEK